MTRRLIGFGSVPEQLRDASQYENAENAAIRRRDPCISAAQIRPVLAPIGNEAPETARNCE